MCVYFQYNVKGYLYRESKGRYSTCSTYCTAKCEIGFLYFTLSKNVSDAQIFVYNMYYIRVTRSTFGGLMSRKPGIWTETWDLDGNRELGSKAGMGRFGSTISHNLIHNCIVYPQMAVYRKIVGPLVIQFCFPLRTCFEARQRREKPGAIQDHPNQVDPHKVLTALGTGRA